MILIDLLTKSISVAVWTREAANLMASFEKWSSTGRRCRTFEAKSYNNQKDVPRYLILQKSLHDHWQILCLDNKPSTCAIFLIWYIGRHAFYNICTIYIRTIFSAYLPNCLASWHGISFPPPLSVIRVPRKHYIIQKKMILRLFISNMSSNGNMVFFIYFLLITVIYRNVFLCY